MAFLSEDDATLLLEDEGELLLETSIGTVFSFSTNNLTIVQSEDELIIVDDGGESIKAGG